MSLGAPFICLLSLSYCCLVRGPGISKYKSVNEAYRRVSNLLVNCLPIFSKALKRLEERGEELAELLTAAADAMEEILAEGQHAESKAFACIDS